MRLFRPGVQHRGGKGGNNTPGVEKSQQCHKYFVTMSQVLSSMQYICFRKISGSNMGARSYAAPDLFRASAAI